MICAETVTAEPSTKNAASSGSLVQPNPVETCIVLPVSPFAPKMRNHLCENVANVLAKE